MHFLQEVKAAELELKRIRALEMGEANLTEGQAFPEKRLDRRTSPGGYQIAHEVHGSLYIGDSPSIQVAMRDAKKYAAMKGTTRVAIFDDLGNLFKVVKEDVVDAPWDGLEEKLDASKESDLRRGFVDVDKRYDEKKVKSTPQGYADFWSNMVHYLGAILRDRDIAYIRDPKGHLVGDNTKRAEGIADSVRKSVLDSDIVFGKVDKYMANVRLPALSDSRDRRLAEQLWIAGIKKSIKAAKMSVSRITGKSGSGWMFQMTPSWKEIIERGNESIEKWAKERFKNEHLSVEHDWVVEGLKEVYEQEQGELSEAMASGQTSFNVSVPKQTIAQALKVIRATQEKVRKLPKKSPQYLAAWVALAKWLMKNNLHVEPQIFAAFGKAAPGDVHRVGSMMKNVAPLNISTSANPVIVLPTGEGVEMETVGLNETKVNMGKFPKYSALAKRIILKIGPREIKHGERGEVIVGKDMDDEDELWDWFRSEIPGVTAGNTQSSGYIKPGEMGKGPWMLTYSSSKKRYPGGWKEEDVSSDGEVLEEAVETLEGPPPWSMKFQARMRIHPQDQKEYGGGKAIRAVRNGNNSELIARLKGNGISGVRFYATQALPKTLADAGYDVWHQGREGGREKWIALRNKGVKVDKDARRASWSAYGEPWNLETYAKKHGIELGPESRFQGEGRFIDGIRTIAEETDLT